MMNTNARTTPPVPERLFAQMGIARRAVLQGLASATLGVPRLAFGQTSGRVRRVVLYSGTPRWKDVVSGGLRDLGWAIGRDALVDWRSTAEIANLEMDLRHELQQPVDAFIMGGPQAIYTAMKVTDKVPIVGIDLESDPVARGFVKSLARPGKNVSGVWMDLPQLAGKQLQFLREVLPGLRH